MRKRQSGSSNTAADCNFSKGIKVRSFVEKTFVDTPFKAEMCLWDNLGNSTDLHWEASIGQVSLLLILNFLCNDNLSLLRMPSGRAGLGLTRLTAALTEVEMHLLVDFLTH